MHRLVAAITGSDTGYCAFVVDREIDTPAPEWLRSGEAPAAVQLLAVASIGAAGYTVAALNDDASEIALADEEVDPIKLLPALAGLAATTVAGATITVYDGASGVVLVVERAAFEEALGCPEHLRDLAALRPVLSAAGSSGAEPVETLARIVALQIMTIAVTALPPLVENSEPPELLPQLAERLDWVREFARAHQTNPPIPGRVLENLGRARIAAVMASRHDHKARRELGKRLAALMGWAGEHDLSWPPF